MRTPLVVLLLLAVVLLFGAACGSSDDSSETSETPTLVSEYRTGFVDGCELILAFAAEFTFDELGESCPEFADSTISQLTSTDERTSTYAEGYTSGCVQTVNALTNGEVDGTLSIYEDGVLGEC